MSKIKVLKLILLFSIAISVFLTFGINASAAVISYGISGELQVQAQNQTEASVTASVKNANYYDIGNISYQISVSDNADIVGDNSKTAVFLSAEQTDSMTFRIIPKKTTTTSLTEETVSQASSIQKDNISESAVSANQNTNIPAKTTALSEKNTSRTYTLTGGTQPSRHTVQTSDHSAALVISLTVIVLISAVTAIFFAKKNKRGISLILCITLTASITAAAVPDTEVFAAESEKYTLIEDHIDIDFEHTTVTVTLTVTFPEQPEIRDNTEDDIRKLNSGNYHILRYDDTNEISFINGRFTDYKVTNYETALSSLDAVKTLLHTKDTNIGLKYIRTQTNHNGDTFYKFEQVQKFSVVSKAFIIVGADKEGNTICLSSSVNPSVSDMEPSKDELLLSAEQAKASLAEIVNEKYIVDIDPALELYTNNGYTSYCWVFYYNTSLYLTETGQDSEGTYFSKLYVDAETGTVAGESPISSIDDSENTYDNDIYFKSVETEIMNFTDAFGNTVSLPTAKDENGYYLIDTQRKIICVDSNQCFFEEWSGAEPYYFEDTEKIDPIFVTVFENVIKTYDFYRSKGIESIDGQGIPLAIGLGYAPYGEEIENAAYIGNLFGFGCFMFSKTSISTALDCAAHEFTHGIRASYHCNGDYINNTGSVEESYADILGNIAEMLIDPDHSDTETWLICEQTGSPLRCMSDPHSYFMPEFIGDVYFMMNSTFQGDVNDNGGVHTNSSILPYICFQMSKLGIGMQENFQIWQDSMMVLTPLSEYQQTAEAVKFTLTREGYEKYLTDVNTLFCNAKLGSNTTSWSYYDKPDGTVAVEFETENLPDTYEWGVRIYPTTNNQPNIAVAGDVDNITKGYIYPIVNARIDFLFQDKDHINNVIYHNAFNGTISEDLKITIDFDDIEIPEFPDATIEEFRTIIESNTDEKLLETYDSYRADIHYYIPETFFDYSIYSDSQYIFGDFGSWQLGKIKDNVYSYYTSDDTYAAEIYAEGEEVSPLPNEFSCPVISMEEYKYINFCAILEDEEQTIISTSLPEDTTRDLFEMNGIDYREGDYLAYQYTVNTYDKSLMEAVCSLHHSDGSSEKFMHAVMTYDCTKNDAESTMYYHMTDPDRRNVTLILDPGTENETVFKTTTLKDDRVRIYMPAGYQLYTDPECTTLYNGNTDHCEDLTLYGHSSIF